MPPKKNPTSVFDASQMKMHLNQHVKQIGDLLTNDETVEQYGAFAQSLYKLNGLTEQYYTLSPDGTYPLLKKSDMEQLQAAYQDAIEQSTKLLSGNETGEVGEQMKTIASEIQPLLYLDSAALEMTNPEKEPVTLPVLIGKARAQAVDMGEQEAAVESGQLSSRQHIKIQNGTTVEEGYFTPSETVQIQKGIQDHFDKLEKKYPNHKKMIDFFRALPQEELLDPYAVYDIYYQAGPGMSQKEIQDSARRVARSMLFRPLGLTKPICEESEQQPDYFPFLDEMCTGLWNLQKDSIIYHTHTNVMLNDGANIDKRNTAVSRMGKLLGKPDLVAEAKPMMLIQNGKPVVGTFMKNAYGVDVSKVKPDDPLMQFDEKNFNNPAAFSDIAAMQALDFICGNVDRHAGNFFLRFDPPAGPNGKLSPDAKLVGLSLIDNDLSFSNATADNKRGNPKFVDPDDMGVIGQNCYNAIKSMTKEQMQFALSDCGLSQEEIDNAWERKVTLQNKIEEDMKSYEEKNRVFW